MIYTYKQKVRGGYYYVVIEAETQPEANAKMAELADTFDNPTGPALPLSHYPDWRNMHLMLSPAMQRRLNEFGYAHDFHTTWLPPYQEREGHYSRLPE